MRSKLEGLCSIAYVGPPAARSFRSWFCCSYWRHSHFPLPCADKDCRSVAAILTYPETTEPMASTFAARGSSQSEYLLPLTTTPPGIRPHSEPSPSPTSGPLEWIVICRTFFLDLAFSSRPNGPTSTG